MDGGEKSEGENGQGRGVEEIRKRGEGEQESWVTWVEWCVEREVDGVQWWGG